MSGRKDVSGIRAWAAGRPREELRNDIRLAQKSESSGRSFIRGYRMWQQGPAVELHNLFTELYPEHPSKFKWKKNGTQFDMAALQRFIDAIYTNNVAQLTADQEEGRAYDVEYPSTPAPTLQRHYVRLPQLLSLLSLKGEVPLPLWGRVSFITDGKSLVPVEMLTHLASVAPHLFEAPLPNVRWRQIKTEGDLFRTLKLRPEQVTTAMYRDHGPIGGSEGPKPLPADVIAARDQAEAHDTRAPLQAEDPETVEPATPTAETPISRNEGNGYVELVTRVESRPTPHFARRVIARGRVIYSATSWSLDGPWHVWERNVSAMLGLGLT